MPKNIVIAIDTDERTLDALALGRVLSEATGVPAHLVTVFPYTPLFARADDRELVRVRDEAAVRSPRSAARTASRTPPPK